MSCTHLSTEIVDSWKTGRGEARKVSHRVTCAERGSRILIAPRGPTDSDALVVGWRAIIVKGFGLLARAEGSRRQQKRHPS